MTYSVQRLAIRAIAISLALSASDAAMAQADEPWQGTYQTTAGIVRLIQDGDRVYGDYKPNAHNETAYIEGRISNDGMILRGTWQKLRARTDNGFVEFHLTSEGFTGDWQYRHNYRKPVWSNARWNGTIQSTARPSLTYAVGRDDYWMERLTRVTRNLRSWVMFGTTLDVSQTVLWDDRAFTGMRQAAIGNTDPHGAAEEELMALPAPQQRATTTGSRPTITRDVGGEAIRSIRNRLGPLGGLLGGGNDDGNDDQRNFPGEMHDPEGNN